MVECKLDMFEVVGSIPTSATIYGGLTQLVRVLVLHTRSYRFESYIPYQGFYSKLNGQNYTYIVTTGFETQ